MGKRSRTADALEAALPFRPAVWDISVKCRGLGCRRHMTHRPRDLREVLSFGKEAFFVRYIPHALAIGCLGIAYAILQDSGRLRAQVSAFILVTAGFGYIAFALWRRWNPGEPTLALSPDGIRFRFTKRHTFVIPWDDVQAVASADIRIGLSMIPAYERNVPVIFVSESFYRDRIFLDSLWQKGPGWRYQFIPKQGLVQVAFFHAVFSQPAADLRAAIEERWRFFSRNPNARVPPRPVLAVAGRASLTRRQKGLVAIGAALLAAPLVWNWQWGTAWLLSSMPDGSRHH